MADFKLSDGHQMYNLVGIYYQARGLEICALLVGFTEMSKGQ